GDGAVLRLDIIVALALVRLGDALLLGALALRLELLPDDIELEIDHALRYGEMVTLGKAVKEPSLQPLMREAAVIAFHLLAHGVAQRLKILHADRLRERFVDRLRLH